MKNIVVFASGSGSNFINIYKCISNDKYNAKIVLLISNNPNCGAVDYAKKNKIDFKIINKYRIPNSEKMNKEYELVLKYKKTDLILLAGFMKKIPLNIVRLYKNKIMNIHPALLPKFGGKGFFGMKVHETVIDAKEKTSGATVHFVDEFYDQGPIIIQKTINISLDDSPLKLSKKILKIEHEIYPKVVRMFCLDKIKLINNKVIIDD
tara:strand:- start:648 stop:1268 length:621 start_codon:yes stop_codon:yes gene_type:complete